MAALIAFVTTHWAEIVALGAAIHAAALIIVNLTPSETDNTVYNKVYKIIEVLAGIITKMAKK